MPLLNYTTTVAVTKTLNEVTALLVQHGARSIVLEFDEGQSPVAVSFLMRTASGDRAFLLPARVDRVFAVLERQSRSGRVPRRLATREQAVRVGWRILKDWLQAQLAIIEAEMVTLDEVMLPYLVNQQGKTLYQVMAENQFLMPGADEKRRRLPEVTA